MMVVMLFVDTTDDVQSCDDRTGVERNLGQRDDGNEDAHYNLQSIGVALGLENVGGDGILDTITEHEHTNYGQAGIDKVLNKLDVLSTCIYNLDTYREGECNVDGLAPFVRVAHVTVNLHCVSSGPHKEQYVAYRRKHGVGAPWTGEETVCKGYSQPVLRKEISRRRFTQRTRIVWFVQTVDNNNHNDCNM